MPELAADAPYTSGDVDVLGDKAKVHECAVRLQGQAVYSRNLTEPRAGHVVFHDHAGNELEIDFMARLEGVSAGVVERTSIRIDLFDNEGQPTGGYFWVMQPVFCMESRIKNVMNLPKHYNTPHGLKQLRASVICAREYLKDLVAEAQSDEEQKKIIDLNEEVFRFCTKDWEGSRAHLVPGAADPFSAIVVDGELEKLTNFRLQRYPRMKAELDAGRKKLTPPSLPAGEVT